MKRFFTPAVLAGMTALTAAVHSQNLTVAITSPGNRASFDPCSQIHITVDARIQTGEIQEVVIYKNGTVIATDKTAPYETNWKNVVSGWYNLSAKVKDKTGNEAFSDTVLIRVGALMDGDQCVNGEFDCALSPWRLDQYENAKATIEIIPDLGLGEDQSGAHIAIQDIGNQTWGVQLMQPFKLQKDHRYEVSFTAQAEGPKPIQVTFSMDYDPYGTHWYQDVTVDVLADYGPFIFDCPLDDPKVMFKFILGGNLIWMDLDAVKIIDRNWTGVEDEPNLVRGYSLEQNYPNPFNPETTIAYTIQKPGAVRLSIYNMSGKEVASWSELQSSGSHRINWNGRDAGGSSVPSGIYLYRLETEGFTSSRKMLVVR
jgi:hypothetical protein